MQTAYDSQLRDWPRAGEAELLIKFHQFPDAKRTVTKSARYTGNIGKIEKMPTVSPGGGGGEAKWKR